MTLSNKQYGVIVGVPGKTHANPNSPIVIAKIGNWCKTWNGNRKDGIYITLYKEEAEEFAKDWSNCSWTYFAWEFKEPGLQVPLQEVQKYSSGNISVPISVGSNLNNHTCPSCKNTRVNTSEKSCWLCGGKL